MFQESSVFLCGESEIAGDADLCSKPLGTLHIGPVDASLNSPTSSQRHGSVFRYSNMPEELDELTTAHSANGLYFCAGTKSPFDTDPLGCGDGDAPSQGATVSSAKNDDEEELQFVDEFGFLMNHEENNKELLYVKNIDGKRALRRQAKWSTMASDWDQMNSKRHAKVKERCRKGIPAAFRGIAWQLLLGSHREMADSSNNETFSSLCRKQLKNPDVDGTIRRDLARTFPKNVLFRDSGGKQAMLHNVLHAYANADPEVEYVQGMAFVVATLLTQMGEEEAFWALLSLMNGKRHHMREVFRPGFAMLQQYFFQLTKLMVRFVPKLLSRFEELGVDPSFYASQWFLTLFVYHFHFRGILRIWDVFMSEGWKIIFRVAIALMKWEERRLLQMEFDVLLPALKTLHENKDPDEILRRAHGVKFKTSELNAYGEEYCRIQREKLDAAATVSVPRL